MSWEVARDACTNMDLELVSIDSALKNSEIVTRFSAIANVWSESWIGLSGSLPTGPQTNPSVVCSCALRVTLVCVLVLLLAYLGLACGW